MVGRIHLLRHSNSFIKKIGHIRQFNFAEKAKAHHPFCIDNFAITTKSRGATMAIKEKIIRNVTVLEIKGKLMGGPETDECHEKVKQLIADGRKNLVIDLSKVKWVNSRGLGMLMACFTSCRNVGGDIKLAGTTEKVNSLLMITKLMTIFETFDNVDQAVGSFS